jgi:serine/threonine protein kinase
MLYASHDAKAIHSVAELLHSGKPEALVLGQYRILDRLGAGGMGRVYLAEHLVMKRTVALKIIAPQFLADAAAIHRFRSEVQVAAQLIHPNIVTAYDAAEAEGLHYLVMEYVAGVDLGRLVKDRGPLPVAVACDYVRQAALGLEYAHELGLVHCDIKPSNLLARECSRRAHSGNSVILGGRPLEVAGEPSSWDPSLSFETTGSLAALIKILDFGLARLSGTSNGPLALQHDPGTVSDLAGTPDYMAPEQARDCTTADIRCDLYSLGCTFYYLLTAQVPYPNGNWAAKLLRHQFDPVPLAVELRPDLPQQIAAIVQRLMAKDPAERYATPAELAQALQEWLARHTTHFSYWLHQASSTLPTQTGAQGVRWPQPLREEHVNKAAMLTAPTSPVPHKDEKTRQIERHRRGIGWPMAIGAAIAAGLLLAWLGRGFVASHATAHPVRLPGKIAVNDSIALASRPGKVFASLEAALQAACDGDTVQIQGFGPLFTGPLVIQGKALTVRAALGSRPRLELAANMRLPWQPLLTTDGPLVVEGLELSAASAGSSSAQPETTHLIYSQRSTLRLVDCRLAAPHGCALLVCREASHVELRNCTVSAAASAVCLEVGNELMANFKLINSNLRLADLESAAISIWRPDLPHDASIRLRLDHNTIRAGRVLALAGLVSGVEVTAVGNTLDFEEAVLSCVGSPVAESWRRAVHWYGRDNHYHSRHGWLAVNGQVQSVRGLQAWRDLWHCAESGSVEKPPYLSFETEMNHLME